MKKLIFGLSILLLVAVSLFTACASTSTSTRATQAQSSTKTALTSESTATTSAVSGNWWDKFGVPKYGGSISIVIGETPNNFDPWNFTSQTNLVYEGMFYPDWTLDRSKWAMAGMFVPEKYFSGNLAESWELTDQQTMTVHLRQGVYWQNKAPVNGREFTSEDVVFHFDRLLGTGQGFTSGSPFALGMLANWEKVTAVDKYTVQYHFKNPCGGVMFYSMSDQASFLWFEASEWVALGGDGIADWKNLTGTGPWILSDYADKTQMTYSKNPKYWGHDLRFPLNQVPYADTFKMLVISDTSTQVAALRTGKIDYMGSVDWQHAQSLSDLDLQKAQVTLSTASGLVYRNDLAPFSDIRVRKALDMSLDRQEIAKSLYNGMTEGIPCGIVTQVYKGYAYDYNDWPQSLKDEYAYNPTQAKELLAEAGYPDGFKTNCVISTSSAMVQLMQVFKAYFMDIGVDMEIKTMEMTTFASYVQNAKHDAMSEHGAGQDWPPTRAIEAFYSKNAKQFGLEQQPDVVYDELRDKFWATKTPDEAAAAMVAADKRLIEMHYGVYMSGASGFNFWQPYLKGYSNEMIFWQQQLLWSRLWIDTDLKKSMGR